MNLRYKTVFVHSEDTFVGVMIWRLNKLHIFANKQLCDHIIKIIPGFS
jgi:hypothetical protein